MTTIDSFLEHHGIKGQKWGVRRAHPSSLTPSSSDHPVTVGVKNDYNNLSNKEFFRKHATTKATYARRVAKKGDPFAARSSTLKKADAKVGSRINARAAAKEAKKNRNSDPKKLTDADLRAAVNRMQLERQFSQLSSETGRGKAGKDFTKSLLSDIGKQQVRRVAGKATDLAVQAAIASLASKHNSAPLHALAKGLAKKGK